jgi:hypothetical protein
MPSAQLQIHSNAATLRICEQVIPVLVVDLPQDLRHQHTDVLANQLLAVMAEHQLGLAIDKPDRALLVHPHQGVRHSVQHTLELCRLQAHPVPL